MFQANKGEWKLQLSAAQWAFPDPSKWSSILNKCLLSFKSKGHLGTDLIMELFNCPS